MRVAVVYYLKEGEEQKEVLEIKDVEEEESEIDGEVEERVTQRAHGDMAMTMRRTRHKLEPQCDQRMSQRTTTTKTETTKTL